MDSAAARFFCMDIAAAYITCTNIAAALFICSLVMHGLHHPMVCLIPCLHAYGLLCGHLPLHFLICCVRVLSKIVSSEMSQAKSQVNSSSECSMRQGCMGRRWHESDIHPYRQAPLGRSERRPLQCRSPTHLPSFPTCLH